MAKNKSDFRDDEPLETAANENEALLARIAELEAQLAQSNRPLADRLQQAVAGLGAQVPPASGYWEVRLEHGPAHVVQAPDSANAWAAYRAEMGVLGSEHAPVVQPAGKEDYRAAQARRYGKRPEEYALPDD